MLLLLLLWPSSPTLHLIVNDPTAAFPAAGHAAMSYEIESLFERNGLDVRVHFREKGRPLDLLPGLRVNVVVRDRAPLVFGLDERTMAAAVGAREDGFTIFLFLPAVRATLGHSPASHEAAPKLVKELSRAAARVTAHELVHVLAPERGHARSGLMTRKLTRRVLLDPRVELDATSRRMAFDRLSRLAS